MESIFGGIVEFHSKEQLRGLTEELTKGLAIKMIEASLEYSCIRNGLESPVIR